MPKYTHTKVKRRGKIDGRDWKYSFWPFKIDKPQEPNPDQEQPAQFENELLKAAENDISKEKENWVDVDKKLKTEYCQSLQRLEHANKNYIKESEEAKVAKIDFEKAKAKYEEFTLPPLSEKWRNSWLFVIAIGEFPLNSIVFQLFGASRFDTYLMSLILCIAIPFLGHAWGEALKQDHKTGGDKGFVLGIPIVILFILGAIAFIRAKFFEAMDTMELMGVEITPIQMTILFIIINIGIFLLAVIISYEASHSNKKQYKSVCFRYKAALKSLEKEATEATQAGQALAHAETEFQTARQTRAKTHEKYLQKANTIVDYTEWLITTYRAANMKDRKIIPPCFKEEPKIPAIPNDLYELDWNCPKWLSGEEL